MENKQDINWGAVFGLVAFVVVISLFYILYTAKYPPLNQFYEDRFLGDPRGSIFETFFTILSSSVIIIISSALFLLSLFCATETYKAIKIGIQKLQDLMKQSNNEKTQQKPKADKESTTTERNK